MAFEISYSDEAIDDLRDLRAFDRAAVFEQIEELLKTDPTRVSKTTIKRLRQPAPTEYRLRVRDHRVFYNVVEPTVFIVRILSKADAIRYVEASL